MPGNIKRIEGAGKYGGYRGDHMSLNQTEKITRGMSGGRIGAGAITFEGWKDHLDEPLPTGDYYIMSGTIKPADIKTWEDRNTDNIGSKLNGPKVMKNNLKKKPRPAGYESKKLEKNLMDKNYGVGQGFKGLGRNELNKRMKQHTALRDKAINKSSKAYDDAKQMGKLIGTFGSEAGFPTKDAKQYQQRKVKTSNAQYKLAKKYNTGLKKLYFDK